MADKTIDVSDIPPWERHQKIHALFEDLASGEALTLINDHEPKPLFYELQAEVEDFDVEGYSVTERAEHEFVATLPKK